MKGIKNYFCCFFLSLGELQRWSWRLLRWRALSPSWLSKLAYCCVGQWWAVGGGVGGPGGLENFLEGLNSSLLWQNSQNWGYDGIEAHL